MPLQDLKVGLGKLADTAIDARLNFQATNRTAKYRFPINHEEEYLGSISFTAIKEDFIRLKDLGEFKELVIKSQNPQAQQAQNTEEALMQQPVVKSPASRAAEFAAHNGTASELQSIKPQKFKGEPQGTVSLYLPASLQFTDGIEYNNVSLGVGGAIAESAIRGGASAMGTLGAMLQDIPLLDLFSKGIEGPAGQLGLQRVLAKSPVVGGEGITNVASLTSGLTLNPNTRSLLRGVSLRRFRFQFNLVPSSKAEAEAIKNIIYFFRTSMYPDDVPAAGVTVGYEFPFKFLIKMRYKGNAVATGILPCYLENFDTNYNPNAMGMMSDGNFPEVNISMGFLEHRTLRKSDIEGGY